MMPPTGAELEEVVSTKEALETFLHRIPKEFQEGDLRLLAGLGFTTSESFEAAKSEDFEKLGLRPGPKRVLQKATAPAAAATVAAAGVTALTNIPYKYLRTKYIMRAADSLSDMCRRLDNTHDGLDIQNYQLHVYDSKDKHLLILRDEDCWQELCEKASSNRYKGHYLFVKMITVPFSDYSQTSAGVLSDMFNPQPPDGGLLVAWEDIPTSALPADDDMLIDGITMKQLMEHVLTTFKLQNELFHRHGGADEARKRSYIQPALFAAIMIANHFLQVRDKAVRESFIKLALEMVLKGGDTHGLVDFLAIYSKTCMLVCEAKGSDLDQGGEGQVIAQMAAARDTHAAKYSQTAGGLRNGRKRSSYEVVELNQINTYAILTNGEAWRLYKFDPSDRRVHKSSDIPLACLPPHFWPDLLPQQLRDLLGCIVPVLLEQVANFDEAVANNPNILPSQLPFHPFAANPATVDQVAAGQLDRLPGPSDEEKQAGADGAEAALQPPSSE